LCKNLTCNFEYGYPESKTDNASEALSYVNSYCVILSMVNWSRGEGVSPAWFTMHKSSSVSEKAESNKDAELDKEDDQVQEPREGSSGGRF
jgi:hypothetical protein